MTATHPAPDAATVAELPLPTFIVIGAQKSATRWLRVNLGRHPDVFTARSELHFWNYSKHVRELGLDWYRAQFRGWAGERFVGEATPGYMMWRHNPRAVARRIRRVIPDARLLAILRNPVDRAQSALLHHVRRERLSPRTRLVEVLRRDPPEREWFGLVSGGWYARSLEPYRAIFGGQLLVLLHDDVRTRPRALYEEALLHVGAAPGFLPPELDDVVFANRSVRGRPELTAEERAEVYAYFRDDVARLEEMLGRDLSVWDPERAREREDLVPPVDRVYDRAALWLGGTLAQLGPEDLARETPAGGSVAEACERIVSLHDDRAARLGAAAGVPAPAGVTERYWHAVLRFRGAVDAALRAGADHPGGRSLDAAVMRGVLSVQLLLCGWDVATATGRDATIPAELVPAAARTAARVFARPGGVPAGPRGDERTTAELVAALGRDPRWAGSSARGGHGAGTRTVP